MSAIITLPSPLSSRLTAIRWRIRLLKSAQGLALQLMLLSCLAASAILLDFWLDLPALARQIIFSTWLTVGAAWMVRGVVVPLFRRIDATALAAVIEEKYPELGERLSSAVELAETPIAGHGSPLLISMLLADASTRSQELDFRAAAPARRVGILAALAAAAVVLVSAPALVWTKEYAELAERFFRPWNLSPIEPPFDIALSPGHIIAARGRPIAISARLSPRRIPHARRDRSETALPESVRLIVVDSHGTETSQTMPRRENGEFTLAHKVAGDGDYRVEAGVVTSDRYRITAVSPVELAPDGAKIKVIPPAYARSAKLEETFRGLVDLAPLQHSEIRFDFRFSRPAVAAYLEVSRDAQRSALALPFGSRPTDANRQTASLEIPALTDCKYRLILEAEHAIVTDLPGGNIQVQIDQPPTVHRFTGISDMRSVLPYERIPFEIEAADDIGVAGIDLEYRVNDGEAVSQPLELQGGNTPSAVSRHVLELAGKVKEDDRFAYRFRVSDNLLREYNGPHVIFYPADHWLTLRIARKGESQQQQEILAQRDEINRRLSQIREGLQQQKQAVSTLRKETRDQSSLPPGQHDSVRQLQRENRESQKALRDVAKLAEETPTLQPVAEAARDVAAKEMQKEEQALEQASKQPAREERENQFQTADQELRSAIKRLDELKKANERLAQERLNQAKLEMLAEREKHLAEQAAELSAKHPVLDPKARELAEKIKRDQAEAKAELERLAQQSEPLKQALHQARQEEARQLAEQARQLAQSQRELAKTEAEMKQQRKANRFAELARQQLELAKEQEDLARHTRSSAPAAHSDPLKPEKAQRAVEDLKQAKSADALRHQEQAMRELERVAQDFDRAAKAGADTRKNEGPLQSLKEQSEQARQMAQRQRELRDQVQRAVEAKRNERPTNQQMDQQRHLQQKTRELGRQFQRLAQETRSSGPMQSAFQRGADHSQQAKQAMQQASEQGQRGDSTGETQSQDRAAQLLEQVSRDAAEAARASMDRNNGGEKMALAKPLGVKAGESVSKASQQMSQAQGQINRGQTAQAQESMQQAAQSLAQAAQQWSANNQPSDQQGLTSGLGRQPGGLPDLSAYGVDKTAYAGKSWGELPGELRTKIVQDMQARYGDDYARMIKSYFEQIADTKKKK